MKRAQRKSMNIIAIFVLILAILSGCTSSKSPDPKPSTATATTTASSATPQGTPEVKVTFENAPVVKIMKIDNTAAQRAESKLNDIDNPYSRYIFQKTGIKVVIDRQPENGYEQKVQLTLASPSGIDLMFLNYSSAISENIARSGALEPVNKYLDKYNYVKSAYNDAYWQGTTFDDNKYLLGAMYLYPRANVATLIRQDWLDKLNLPMPKTVDDLYNVAKAFADKKPDGQKLTFGLTGRKNLSYFYAFSAAYGNPSSDPQRPYIYLDKAQQKIALWQNTDAARAYYVEAQKFWKAGLVDKEGVTNSGDQFWNEINNGQVGIVSHQAASAGWLTTSIRQTQKNNKALLTVIPPLTGTGFKNPFGTEGAYETTQIFDGFFGVPKGDKNIDNVMKVLDFYCSKDGLEFSKYGLAGIEHDVVDGKKKFTKDRSKKVGFLGDYLITGDPAMVKDGEFYDLAMTDFGGGGDPALDPEADAIDRVKKAFAISTPNSVPTQDWSMIIPRLPEEDKYPDYITAITALYMKMVTGVYDATKDSDWTKYLSEVDKTGINVIMKAKEDYLKAKAPQFFK